MIKLDIDDEIIEVVNLHTHTPLQTQVELTKVKANIKRKAQTTTDTPQQILGAELRKIWQDAPATILSTSTLRRSIRKDNDAPHNDVPNNSVTR